MKLHYNSPVVLSFTLAAAAVMAVSQATNGMTTQTFFSTAPGWAFSNPLTYFRLVSHVLGHANWDHLLGNFTFILLIGPLLEEKYGSTVMLEMIGITAFITGILNNFFFQTGLLGASGIVFMMILLSSFANLKSGKIPLTFLLIVGLFLGREVVNSFAADNVSQFAHILGGLCGAAFGFLAQPNTLSSGNEKSITPKDPFSL